MDGSSPQRKEIAPGLFVHGAWAEDEPKGYLLTPDLRKDFADRASGLDPRILNERIIARICERGKPSREAATTRYALGGGFCRDQLELLAGRALPTYLD